MKKWLMRIDDAEYMFMKEGRRKHHVATVRTYVSRRTHLYDVAEYEGKYGKGYTILLPNWQSSRYSYIAYYVK